MTGPFPWNALEVLSRDHVFVLSALRRWDHAEAAQKRLTELAGAPVQGLLRRVLSRPVPLCDGVGVLLEVAHRHVLIEVESALAAILLARTLRRPPPRILDTSSPVGASLAGGFAALVAAVVRRVQGIVRVHRAGASATLAAELPEGIVVVELAVLLGEDTFVARVWVPREVLVVAPQGACWSGASLANLGSMRLGLTIVASTCMVPVMDIAALGVGDVWRVGCVGSWRLGGPVLSGPVVLAAVGAEQGVAGELRLDGGVVMTGDMEGLARSDQMKDTTAVVEAVGDAPVLVRVELGTVELRAREWASLGPGDVVSLGCPLGTAVVLRAGSVEIGRGELVDLEGEVGVRLLVRFDRPPYPAA